MRCPVCLGADTAPFLAGADYLLEMSARTFQLSACAGCHCLFIDPPPAPEEIATFYPSEFWWKREPGLLKKLEGVYRRVVLHDHMKFITRAARHISVSRPPCLLDVGCGPATLLGLLKQRGFDVLGLDTSVDAARIAETEHGVHVIVRPFNDTVFESESFDIVTFFHVLEHVTSPREVLAEAARILRPDGRIVLQVPNIESWQFRVFGANWYGLQVPRHVIDYSKRSMLRLLDECGFTVVRTRDFNLRDNAAALASSIFPALDPAVSRVRLRRRPAPESSLRTWLGRLAYLMLVVSASPFAFLESAAGCGATVMVEASKR